MKLALSLSLVLASTLGAACVPESGPDLALPEAQALTVIPTPTTPPFEADVRAMVGRLVGSNVPRKYVGLSVIVIKDGKRYLFNYGEAVAGTGVAPDANTLYALGSVTKTFTGTLLASFNRAHYVAWNDLLTDHVSENLTGGREQITLRDLALHHSGLPHDPPGGASAYKTGSYAGDRLALRDALVSCTSSPCQEPLEDDEPSEYSNWGFAILADVLAASANKSIPSLFKDFVFTPLGMSSTGYKYQLVDPTCLATNTTCTYDDYGACTYRATCNSTFHRAAAVGYQNVNGVPTRTGSENGTGSNDYVKAGSGTLWSTPNDMTKWLAYQMNADGTASPATLAVLSSAQLSRTDAELAFFGGYQYTDAGERYLRKVGTITNQFNTFMGFTEDRTVGVVVLANYSSYSVTTLGERIIDTLH